MKTKPYWLIFLFFLTGCYTQVKVTYPVKKTAYPITHLLATTSAGDTTKVNINNFKTIYYNNPTYYTNWKIYYNNRWMSPYSYYRYYYRPYQPIYVYYPYPSWDIQNGNQRPQPKIDKPSQPRSSGTSTQQRTRNNESSRTSSTRRTRNQ